MFRGLFDDVNIWDHQRRAIDFVINAFNEERAKTCLVRMPTGTGKTGVIACLSVLCANDEVNTIILTPWTYLRKQTLNAIRQNFWNAIGYDRPRCIIHELTPATARRIIETKRPKVAICTFSTLTSIRRTDSSLYIDISNYFQLAIVDECHYEPSVEWGKSVKRLRISTLLLTATPYRNDEKLFNIQDTAKCVHHYTHHDAERDGIIRRVAAIDNVIHDGATVTEMANTFAQNWPATRAGLPSRDAKAIICCKSKEDIKTTVDILNSRGIAAIGIHERFPQTGGTNFFKHIPRSSNAEVWVHQHKLTEGIDDHRFCCLALFFKIQNDRKLIQQIGRILRKSSEDRAGSESIILAPPSHDISETLRNYRSFEQSNEVYSNDHYKKYIYKIIRSQPAIEYLDGRFRKRFSPRDLARDHQVCIPPSVTIRRLNEDFDFDEYISDCTDTINLSGACILGERNGPCFHNENTALWVYASIENSKALMSRSLYEVRIQTHCVAAVNGHILISDTTGTIPEHLLEEKTKSISADSMMSLLSGDFTITNVSVASSIIHDNVPKASTHTMHSLDRIPSSLIDKTKICRAARGKSQTETRYVGAQRSRVRKELPESIRCSYSLNDFVLWASLISRQIANAEDGNSALSRYIQPCPRPNSIILHSISIDFSSVHITVNGDIHLSVDSYANIFHSTEGSAFTCAYTFCDQSNEVYTVQLHAQYNAKKDRFIFKARSQAEISFQITGDPHGRQHSLGELLNKHNDLLIICLRDGETVYQGGNFYKIDYAHAETQLLSRIITHETGSITTEKGSEHDLELLRANGSTQFPAGSIFKAIAEEEIPLDFQPDVIICDDIGAESSDFILANTQQRKIAFVHAKSGKGRMISASSFHEVVAQALKNIAYLTGQETPRGARNWTAENRWNNTSIPRLYKHPASLTVAGEEIWNFLNSEIIQHPKAQIFIYLVTTGCCKKAKLANAIQNPRKRTPATAQLMRLLDGLNGYSRLYGASLFIYDCTPPPR